MATVDDLAVQLAAHERISEDRYMHLEHGIKKLEAEIETLEEEHESAEGHKMTTQPVNIFEGAGTGGGVGAAMGGGLGAGLLGGILGGALLGGNGLFGNRNGFQEGPVTPSQLTAALTGVQDNQMNTAVLQELGKISGAIPAAEGQVQLALAQAQGQLSNQIGQQSLAVAQGFGNTSQQISTAQAAVIAVGESVKDAVNITSAATQLGIANLATAGLQNTYAVTNAVREDGEKTRALIVAQNEANLQRQLAVAEARLAEERAESRARGTEVNVTQTVNQNQMQMQAQQQQQQQLILLHNLANVIGGLQNAVATNSNLIVGNTGAVATGAQTANPVNVRA